MISQSGATAIKPTPRKRLRIDQQWIAFGLFVFIFLLFSVFLEGFFSAGNMLTMLRSISVLGILGMGMAIVVIGRGVDLSMVALLAVPTAMILTQTSHGMGLGTALALGILLTLAFGLLNGFLVAYAEIPSLFTTLATGLGIAGIGQAHWFIDFDLVPWPEQMDPIRWLGGASVAGIPSPVIAFAVATAFAWFFLRKTKLGLFTYAIGDNPNGARTTGIPVRPVIVLGFVLTSLFSVYAGLVMAASAGLMDTRMYNLTLIYDVVLVVVIGGVGLSGGRGGVWNVLVGTLLVGTIINGMTMMNFALDVQNIIKGIVLLIAITVDSLMNPRNEETAQQGDI